MGYKQRFKEQLRDMSIYKDPKVKTYGLHFDSDRDRRGWAEQLKKPTNNTNARKNNEGSER